MLSMYVLTDIHYYSKKGWRGGDPYAFPRENDQLQYRESEEIFLEALDIIKADKTTDIVFITGDLAKNGSTDSHDELVAYLKEFAAAGKRVFVINSLHDYPEDHPPTYFDEQGVKHRKGVKYPRETVHKMYDEFGRTDAIAVYAGTGSYVAQLDENHRLFAINDDIYIGNTNRGLMPSQFEWIKEQLEDAKAHDQHVIFGVHHPLIPASPVCTIIGKRDMMGGRETLLPMLAEYGVPIAFTGHMHMHDIDFYRDDNGVVYDVATAALTGYPPVFRKVTFDFEAEQADVKTIVINDLSRFDLKGKALPEYCTETFFGYVEELLDCMANDYPKFQQLADAISIRPDKSKKLKWIFQPVGKFLNRLTIGKIGRWTKKESGLTKADFEHIKDEKVVHFIVGIVEGLYSGKTDLTPEAPEYKVAMGLIAILQSVADCLPISLKKILGYDNLFDFTEPLFYNNGIDSYDATLDFKEAPPPRLELPVFKSRKGPFIVLIIVLIALILSPILLPAGIILAIVLLIKKSRKKRKKRKLSKEKNR